MCYKDLDIHIMGEGSLGEQYMHGGHGQSSDWQPKTSTPWLSKHAKMFNKSDCYLVEIKAADSFQFGFTQEIIHLF